MCALFGVFAIAVHMTPFQCTCKWVPLGQCCEYADWIGLGEHLDGLNRVQKMGPSPRPTLRELHLSGVAVDGDDVPRIARQPPVDLLAEFSHHFNRRRIEVVDPIATHAIVEHLRRITSLGTPVESPRDVRDAAHSLTIFKHKLKNTPSTRRLFLQMAGQRGEAP